MKDVIMKIFINEETEESTKDIAEAKSWVESGKKDVRLYAFVTSYNDGFTTSPVVEIDLEKKLVTTRSGSQYHIVQIEETAVKEITIISFLNSSISDCPFAFNNDYEVVQNWLDNGDRVTVDFLFGKNRPVSGYLTPADGTTSFLKKFDSNNRTFRTRSGSIYSF